MNNLLCVFFCSFLWGGFLFKSVDCWHAQGQFIQLGILVLFCYSFFEKPRYSEINKPLGAFVLWAGLVTAYNWIQIFSLTQHYPVKTFMPFFNLVCIVLLYKLIVEYVNENSIEKILKGLKYSVIVLLFYGVIQYLNMDEFFKSIKGLNDQLVGTIGNPRHFAGLLAIVQPLFFKKNLLNILSLILLWLLIIVIDSATGFVTGIAVTLFWLFFKNRKLAIRCFGLSTILIVAMRLVKPNFFFNSDRFRVWGLTCKLIKSKFICGQGLGAYGVSGIGDTGNYHWQHAHNEYLQIVLEMGAIGLVLALWVIWDYFKTFSLNKTDLSIKLASIFFGFCILSAVTFTAHLWQIAVISTMAYGFLYALKSKEASCALG